jgi:superfamily II DNA or RNA helicase
MVSLRFDRGTILIKGNVGTPYGKWDPRIDSYRIKGAHYRDVLNYLNDSGVKYKDNVLELPPIQEIKSKVELRSYQLGALKKWCSARHRGVIVLPTAAGKTYIALKAIELLNVQTLIVVPTLDLIDQWKNRINENLDVDTGVFGGGKNTIKMITVSTYDSAYLHAEELGNKFMLIIFDEVHHLASPNYMQIGEMYVAPYRMGLTATLERIDERHLLLSKIIGDVVYSMRPEDLTGKHLSPYEYEKIYVELTPKEKKEYNKIIEVFRQYLNDRGIRLRSAKDFQRLIMSTGRDKNARDALLARNRALKIAFNSESKLNTLAELIEKYRSEKILIFTLHNNLVYRISKKFLLPAITYQTPKNERRRILDGFRSSEFKALVTSQVLDEGIDVPDASLGIILSGTGSKREYIQRLGRILRRVDGKKAKLIEIVTKETVEVRISQRRRKKR